MVMYVSPVTHLDRVLYLRLLSIIKVAITSLCQLYNIVNKKILPTCDNQAQA